MVVVFEYLREGRQSTDEIHQEHPRDRIAAELVHRDDARGRRGYGTHTHGSELMFPAPQGPGDGVSFTEPISSVSREL